MHRQVLPRSTRLGGTQIQKQYARKGMDIINFETSTATQCFASNIKRKSIKRKSIKRKRAQISSDMIREHFTKLAAELDGVPPCNIWNYDETNLTDDPVNKYVIAKRKQD